MRKKVERKFNPVLFRELHNPYLKRLKLQKNDKSKNLVKQIRISDRW